MTLPFMMCCKTTILFLIIPTKLLDIVFASAQESKILGIFKRLSTSSNREYNL